jgi:hypothetical protein
MSHKIEYIIEMPDYYLVYGHSFDEQDRKFLCIWTYKYQDGEFKDEFYAGSITKSYVEDYLYHQRLKIEIGKYAEVTYEPTFNPKK